MYVCMHVCVVGLSTVYIVHAPKTYLIPRRILLCAYIQIYGNMHVDDMNTCILSYICQKYLTPSTHIIVRIHVKYMTICMYSCHRRANMDIYTHMSISIPVCILALE